MGASHEQPIRHLLATSRLVRLRGFRGWFGLHHLEGVSVNLYLISQDDNNDCDTFDSAVVAAESEEDAKTIHPSGNPAWEVWDTWCPSESVKVDFLCGGYDGVRGVILASFNAG